MGFWENFWLFVPPVALVIAGFVYYFMSRRGDTNGVSDDSKSESPD